MLILGGSLKSEIEKSLSNKIYSKDQAISIFGKRS